MVAPGGSTRPWVALARTWGRVLALRGGAAGQSQAAAALALLRLLGFELVGRAGRLGGDAAFLPALWAAYRASGARDRFFAEWLPALMAACAGPAAPPPAVAAIRALLPNRPDLRGTFLAPHPALPDPAALLTDAEAAAFFALLESCPPAEADEPAGAAISPALLAAVYESLAPSAAGVIYTARTEIELMCRLAVVDSLAHHLGAAHRARLYAAVFAGDAAADAALSAGGLWPALSVWLDRVRVLDPACGAGAFLVGMLAVLADLAQRTSRALDMPARPVADLVVAALHGVDIQPQAMQVAALCLWLQVAALAPGAALPPPATFQLRAADSLLDDPFPAQRVFDIVIGNPPYVRQEAIGPPAYKAALSRAVYRRFPAFFGYDAVKDQVARPLDARGDLYLYFYFQGVARLAPGGTLCFLTSNAWLDVRYGARLRAFLAAISHIRLVIDDQAQRSFAAEINTVIVLLRGMPPAADAKTRFVRCAVPFAALHAPTAWAAIDTATTSRQTAEYSVIPVPQAQLAESPGIATWSGRGIGAGWGGTYLRMPDILRLVLDRAGDRLVPLATLAQVQTGMYTGINEFFYLDAARIAAFGIEPQFLVPVIRSPRAVPRLRIDPDVLDTWLFVCREDKATLAARGHAGALAYIAWGETQVTRARQKVPAGVRWLDVPTVARRHPGWWALVPPPPAHLFLLYGIGARHGQRYSAVPLLSDRRFHMLAYSAPFAGQETLAAILNTILTVLCIELQGRTNLGQGVLDFATMDARRLRVLDPARLVPAEQAALRAGLHAVWDVQLPALPDPTYRATLAPLNRVLARILRLTPGEEDDLFGAARDLVAARLRKAASMHRDGSTADRK